jgi:hypothetical protein
MNENDMMYISKNYLEARLRLSMLFDVSADPKAASSLVEGNVFNID